MFVNDKRRRSAVDVHMITMGDQSSILRHDIEAKPHTVIRILDELKCLEKIIPIQRTLVQVYCGLQRSLESPPDPRVADVAERSQGIPQPFPEAPGQGSVVTVEALWEFGREHEVVKESLKQNNLICSHGSGLHYRATDMAKKERENHRDPAHMRQATKGAQCCLMMRNGRPPA